MPYILPEEAASLAGAILLFEQIAMILDEVAVHVNASRAVFPAPGRALRINIGKQFGEHARLTMRNTPQAPSIGVAAGLFWREPDPALPAASRAASAGASAHAMIGIEVAHESKDPDRVRSEVRFAMTGVPGWTSVNRGTDDWAVLVVYKPASDFVDQHAMVDWLKARFNELLGRVL